MLTFRYPDKPVRSAPSALPLFKGNYRALTKLDGWRCELTIDGEGEVSFISRAKKPLPVGETIRKAARALVKDGKVPFNSVIDGEWMKRRPDYDGPECLYLFSPTWLAGEWVGHLPFRARWEWVNGLCLPVDNLSTVESSRMENHPLIIPASVDSDFVSFFNANKNVWRTEGIVIYKLDGIMYGDLHDSKKSRDMVKIKWRDGHDGRTEI